MVLLDHLINTSEDVELLVDEGIIVNALGSYQEVANMVNKIALEIVEENSCYADVAKKLRTTIIEVATVILDTWKVPISPISGEALQLLLVL